MGQKRGRWIAVFVFLAMCAAGAAASEEAMEETGMAEKEVHETEVGGRTARNPLEDGSDVPTVVVQGFGVPYSQGTPSDCMKKGCRFAEFAADVARKMYDACISSVPSGPNVPSAQHLCGELLIALQGAEWALERCYTYAQAADCQDDENTKDVCRKTFGWPGFC